MEATLPLDRQLEEEDIDKVEAHIITGAQTPSPEVEAAALRLAEAAVKTLQNALTRPAGPVGHRAKWSHL